MKKSIAFAACALLVACDSPTAPSELQPQFARGGNPHFSADATFCSVTQSEAACQFKLVGLGKNAEAVVVLSVDSREVYQCANPKGKIVHGHSDRVRLGSASGEFRSDKNGSITGSLKATIEYDVQHGDRPCPTGHSIVPSSVVVETLWDLRATGHNKSTGWTAVLTS